MNDLLINGYGDELTINNIKIGDLSPKEHEAIEKEIKSKLSVLPLL
mgnify:CR=1 FL=1